MIPEVTPDFLSISKRSLSTETKAISIPEKKAEKAMVINKKITVSILSIYGILMAQIIEVNLLAGIISNHFVMVLVQTVISTLIILVTGEFLPKTLFKINPNLMLRVCAIPLFICYVILFPVSKFASGLSYLFLRIFGMKVNKEASAKAFGKVDLDYFIQSSIENAESEE